jgi:hypothetical protein
MTSLAGGNRAFLVMDFLQSLVSFVLKPLGNSSPYIPGREVTASGLVGYSVCKVELTGIWSSQNRLE